MLLRRFLQKTYQYKDFEVLHTVKPRMKNIYFRIGEDGVVRVNSSKISQKRLFELLDEREQWIRTALEKIEKKPTVVLGREILYFGETYQLVDDTSFENLEQLCINSDEKMCEIHYQNFYKSRAQNHLRERLDYFAARMNLQPKEMKLRRMKRQWGNCRSSGVITFNIHLMQVPTECIDYVVVHELAHMVHMNHSKVFHTLVEQHLPQSSAKRNRLKAFRAGLAV